MMALLNHINAINSDFAGLIQVLGGKIKLFFVK